MEMKSSSSLFLLRTHLLVTAGLVNSFQESIKNPVALGCTLGVSLSYSQVIWYKNILCFKSLMTVNTSDLHGKTKSNG